MKLPEKIFYSRRYKKLYIECHGKNLEIPAKNWRDAVRGLRRECEGCESLFICSLAVSAHVP